MLWCTTKGIRLLSWSEYGRERTDREALGHIDHALYLGCSRGDKRIGATMKNKNTAFDAEDGGSIPRYSLG